MTDINSFVAYLSDPFHVQGELIYLIEGDEAGKLVSKDELSNVQFVTYDPWKLVDEFSSPDCSMPKLIISLNDALKIRSGRSRDQGGERSWNVWKALKPFIESITDYEAIISLIENRLERPKQIEATRLLDILANAVKCLWKELANDLDAADELQRYLFIECPIQQIFYSRQRSGVGINSALSIELMRDAKKEKYLLFQQIASILGFSPADLNYRNISDYLWRTDADYLLEFSGMRNFSDYFKLAQTSSRFAKLFVDFKRVESDIAVLARIAASTNRVHPIFHCFGTVTSRILVADPRLQEIRKKFRAVLVADVGKKLAYLDYAQFEPGILAFISKDESFIREYNSNDLYISLSRAVFEDDEHRDFCKRIFLGFCYGMSKQNMAKLVVGANGDDEKLQRVSKSINEFFESYPGLDVCKKNLEMELEKTGYISSFFGNRRNRGRVGKLSGKEERWAVNQRVQGTASLIFKEALIKIAERFGSECILLPMHDAILLQFEEDDKYDDAVAEAKKIMIDAFKYRCPSIQAKVTVGMFTLPLTNSL
jgi:DNA polymerase-1